MDEFSIKIPAIFKVTPKPIEVDAREFGIQLASDDCDKQAAILAWWAFEISSWQYPRSWELQCRAIAESLTNNQCHEVRLILESLTCHLEAVPLERESRKQTATTSPKGD